MSIEMLSFKFLGDGNFLHIKKEFDKLDKDRQNTALSQLYMLKDPNLAFKLSIFLGFIGVDRFYKGDLWLGTFKMIVAIYIISFSVSVSYALLPLLLIWWGIDIFFVQRGIRKQNDIDGLDIIKILQSLDKDRANLAFYLKDKIAINNLHNLAYDTLKRYDMEVLNHIYKLELKKSRTATLLGYFLGIFGFDSVYLGDIKNFIFKIAFFAIIPIIISILIVCGADNDLSILLVISYIISCIITTVYFANIKSNLHTKNYILISEYIAYMREFEIKAAETLDDETKIIDAQNEEELPEADRLLALLQKNRQKEANNNSEISTQNKDLSADSSESSSNTTESKQDE